MNSIDKAEAYYYEGRYTDAIKEWSKIINSSRSQETKQQAYRKRATNYWILGNHRAAIRDSTEAINLLPEDTYSYFVRGNAYKGLQYYKEAKEDFWKAIDFGDESAAIYAGLAEVTALSEGEENAIRYFTKAFLAANTDNERDMVWRTIKRLGIISYIEGGNK